METAKYLESTLFGLRIDFLVMMMREATDRYSAGKPIMTDAQYDTMEAELRRIDPKNTALKIVGHAIKPEKTGLSKIKHAITMGSLNKAQTESEISAWFRKVSHAGDLVATEKLDGISVSLIYANGQLTQAATRGDGSNGEDITRNVMLMRGVKKNIPDFTGEIRGEILILKSDFHNFPGASNTRNSAAGAAKSIHDNSKCRYCTVMCYRVISTSKKFISKTQELGWLNSNDIPVTGIRFPVRSLDDIRKIYRMYIDEKREQLNYDIDGLVFEVNNNQAALDLLQDPSYPEYAIAYKFPHATGITTLRDIEWQVGHTGRITPVGIFDEVNLVGANVSRASLATYAFVKNMHLRVGDTIEVSRRNDVIPKIERVIEHTRNSEFLAPSLCPVCKHVTEIDGEYIICPNIGGCQAQLEGSISNWLKKIGVLEWGDSIVHEIVEQGLVENVSDLYLLSTADLSELVTSGWKRVGEKNALTMVDNLESKKVMPLHVFIGSLGIKGIGRSICKSIVDAGYDTLQKMEQASEYDIQRIQGMGELRAMEFTSEIARRHGVIHTLLLNGVKISKPSAGSMKGKSVCMTGFRDAEMVETIESKGGTVKSSVSRDLTYLVQKDASSKSSKSDKAREYGVRVISQDEMLRILRGV